MAITGSIPLATPLYFGPNPDIYVFDVSVQAGTNVTIFWTEGLFYYVEFIYMGAPRRNYIERSRVTGITGGIPPTYTPSFLTRYVYGDGYARLGPSTSYSITSSLAYRQSVQYLDGKKSGDFAFVEFTETGATKKKRGWFESLKLTVVQATPQIYTDGHVFNSDGEYWDIGTPWNGYQGIPNTYGHLAIDITRKDSSGAQVYGKEVYAIAAGTIVEKSYYSANGYYVIIRHTTSVGNIYYSLYFHLDSYYYKTTVSAGEAIGVMGNTGTSSLGEHLHLSITKSQPRGNSYGYYYVNDVKTKFTETGPGYFDCFNNNGTTVFDNRYYNPTIYFQDGESLINNNYS